MTFPYLWESKASFSVTVYDDNLTLISIQTVPKLWIRIINITSNNQRLWSVGDNDQRSKHFCSNVQCALCKFHITNGQNTRDQIIRDRRSKHVWSNCMPCIPFIVSGSPNEFWLHTRDACAITTWRLGLHAPLVACKNVL